MTLLIEDYSRLRSLVSSKVVSAFSDPALLHNLHQELNCARLMELEELPEGVIAMNSTMTLRDIRTGGLETYTLVYPARADIANRRLSVLTPAGVAVLGCRTGDDIHWPAAAGWRPMKVEKVVGAAPLQPSVPV